MIKIHSLHSVSSMVRVYGVQSNSLLGITPVNQRANHTRNKHVKYKQLEDECNENLPPENQ